MLIVSYCDVQLRLCAVCAWSEKIKSGSPYSSSMQDVSGLKNASLLVLKAVLMTALLFSPLTFFYLFFKICIYIKKL